MSEILAGGFKDASEAIAYRQKLEERKQKDDLSETLTNLKALFINSNEKKDSTTIELILTQLLHSIKIPTSVSFLNISFASFGMRNGSSYIINESFLKNHQDKFKLVCIGNDLKLCLRNKDVDALSKDSSTLDNLVQIFHKDDTKLIFLEKCFTRDGITRVLYEDLINDYSTNKYKMNLPFIVRNSHRLKISSEGRKTYVQFCGARDNVDDMNEREVLDILFGQGTEHFFVGCMQNLLKNFFAPINQGNLQSCFCLGSVVVDKKFLLKRDDLFDGFGSKGVVLKENCVPLDESLAEPKLSTKKSSKDDDEKGVKEKLDITPFTTQSKISSNDDYILKAVKTAMAEERSVILVGRSSFIPIILDIPKLENHTRLKYLLSIRDAIDKELMGK